MDKKSFLIYLDYKEHFDLLTDEQLGQLLRAIMKYEETREVPEMDGILKMAFSFIKKQLDRDRDKYKEKCEKNKENGRLGGRPKKQTDTEKPNGFENNQTVFEETEQNPTKPKKPDIRYMINDTDTEKDKDNSNSNKDLAVVVSTYEENIGLITPHIADKLQDYLKDFSKELIVTAIQKADEAGNRNFKYVKGILDNWLKSGVKTLQDVKKQDEEFKNRKVLKSNAEKDNKKAPASKGISPYAQRTYDNLDFLYANKTKKESDTDDNDSNSTNEL